MTDHSQHWQPSAHLIVSTMVDTNQGYGDFTQAANAVSQNYSTVQKSFFSKSEKFINNNYGALPDVYNFWGQIFDFFQWSLVFTMFFTTKESTPAVSDVCDWWGRDEGAPDRLLARCPSLLLLI